MLSERINKDTPSLGTGRPPRGWTSTYPTRYAAREAPGVLVVLRPDEQGLIHPAGFGPQPGDRWMASQGRELASFTSSFTNRDWPGVTDGISVEILSQTAKLGGVVLRAQATVPALSRQSLLFGQTYATLAQALDAAEAWVETARAWVAEHLERDRAITVSGHRLTLRRTEEGFALIPALGEHPVALLRGYEPLPEKVELLGWSSLSKGRTDAQLREELAKAVSVGGRDGDA